MRSESLAKPKSTLSNKIEKTPVAVGIEGNVLKKLNHEHLSLRETREIKDQFKFVEEIVDSNPGVSCV